MSTLKDKVSLQIENQLPDFVQSENPNFISFMKAYYEFMESAELKLTTLGSVDSVILENQPIGSATLNFVTLQDTNIYRTGETDSVLLQDYDQFWRDGSAAVPPTPTEPASDSDVLLPAVLVRTVGAFVNGETIRGQTSQATAIIRVEDINANSRLFISSQNDFIIGEQIVGATSNASGIISDYTANPVQNIQQLMEYADVDDTVDQFFDQFKEAFLKTIPRDLTAGVNERNLLKNIKDLYRAKGTRKGHELFFRILLNEDISVSYPRTDMLRVSAGQWSEEQILRVSLPDDTMLMENSTPGSDIFILDEDGAQIMQEDGTLNALQTQTSTVNLLNLVGQEITQQAVVDLSILAGGVYYNLGYPIINKATALVDSITAFTYGGQNIYELVLSTGSIDGTFATGHTVTATSNADPDLTLTGKMVSIVTEYNLADSTSSQYYDITDPLTVVADNGSDATVKIDSLTSGDIKSIIVDAGGSGYNIGDQITVNNANTNGAGLIAKVSVVNGGVAPEAGDLVGEWGIELETAIGPGQVQLETASGPGEIKQEEAYDMLAVDHFVLEDLTVFNDGEAGNKIAQESGTGNGDVTDIVVTTVGDGYTKTPLLTLPPKSLLVNDAFRIELQTATATGDLITEDGQAYVGQEYYNPGSFTVGETITGSDSGATGTVLVNSTTTEVFFTPILGTFVINEAITGSSSAYTKNISSVAGIDRTGGTVYAKGTNVGKIRDVTILDPGAHYTDDVTITGLTNFLCTDISGTFTPNETVTGGTSGATGVYKSTEATRNVIKLSVTSGTFLAGPEKSGETITGSLSGETAIIDSYTPVSLKAKHGTLGETSGKFLNEDGFLDERSKKIQDSYYYQDYSYVVKSSNSINTWRDQLLASVHPAGWQVFGSVDLISSIDAIANITSIVGLGPLFKIVYTMLLGRRLGTTDQLPLNPFPAVGIHDPASAGNSFRITDSSGTITKGALITGNTSGATATAISDTTNDQGVNLLSYEFLAGGNAPPPTHAPGSVLFEEGETITMSGVYTGTATIVNIYGLQGRRDVTLFRYFKVIKPPIPMTGERYSFHPNLGDANEWKFSYGMVSSANSARTFNSMAVYPVYLNMLTTITSAINDAVATIPVAATDNLPTQGTIKLGAEEITYTGRSSASGAGNLTGCTRGANSTTAVSHLINANLTLVRLARSQSQASGFRLTDWATDWRGVALTIGDFATYPQRKNNISAPTEITIWKT